MIENCVVISLYRGLFDYLVEEGVIDARTYLLQTMKDVIAEDFRGKNVVIDNYFSIRAETFCLAESVTKVSLNLTFDEMKNYDMMPSQIKRHLSGVNRTFVIQEKTALWNSVLASKKENE